MWMQRSKIRLLCGINWWKLWTLTKLHHFLTTCALGMHSTRMQTEWNYHWTAHEDVWVTYLCWCNRKITGCGGNLTQKRWCGPTTWKDMLRYVLNDTANWQTRKLSNFTKYRIFVWMIINSNRRNLNQSENCQKFARKLSLNACIWHELDDLTPYPPWICYWDQSQTGLKLVTNA